MPDISMCDNKECTIRETCYRFMAEPSNFRQSYIMDVKQEPDGTCKYHMEIYKKKEK